MLTTRGENPNPIPCPTIVVGIFQSLTRREFSTAMWRTQRRESSDSAQAKTGDNL
jgi:hypothetical protein